MPAGTPPAKHYYDGVVWQDLTPPEKHPGYHYEGHTPGKIVDLPRGHVLRPGYGAFRIDTTLEVDVKVRLRNGVNIYINVYRPSHGPKLPVIIAWSPYGKCSGGIATQNYDVMGPFRIGIPYQNLSGYETFEGPNPADWCERGYVIVDPDARGACHSEGNIVFWGQQEAEDVYDLIDWCSKQPWCDGKVSMFGNSWLAISQINHASRCPHPALKAIAPWEAMNDIYMDSVCRGGVVNNDGFAEMIMSGFAGLGKAENPFATVGRRPLYDDYWASKHIDVEKLDIPMYLTASYSSRIHSFGSFNTFAKAKSKNKWLRVHTTQEWHDLYQQKTMDDLQKFYDYFLKGKVDNGWMDTPPLRLSLLGFDGSPARTIEERPETDTTFPLSRTRNLKFYLDAANSVFSSTQPSHETKIFYDSHSLTGLAAFTMKFDKHIELSGLPWVKLHMSCKSKDDMDVNVIVRKIGINGNLLEHANYPMPAPINKIPNCNIAKYQGPNGVLRASHRISQVSKSDPDDYPSYTHRSRELIEPGTVVALEIPIWPIGMVLEAGEGVQLVIAGHDLKLPEILLPREGPSDQNVGLHNVHTGGKYDSFLVLPFIS